uniref:Uncharacterized protein n=1 Tax=Glossina morsitans morsitans TaxID=37546 RepID=A0A1B0GDK6_GLOMM
MLDDHDIADFVPYDKRQKLIGTKLNQPRYLS